MKKTLTAPVSGVLTVTVRAGSLELDVIASESTRQAEVELSGPEKELGQVRAERHGSGWSLTWPEGAGGGRNMTVISGGGTSTFISGGRISGRVIVNGVDVTAMVNGQGGSSEPLRAVLRVPSGSSVDADLSAGTITMRGTIGTVRSRTQSADLQCDGPVSSIEASSQSGDVTAEECGPVTASTMSGDVEIGGAKGAVTASTMSGDVRVHALASVAVNASTMSGDVRVTAAPGVRPHVNGRSVSGKVRTP